MSHLTEAQYDVLNVGLICQCVFNLVGFDRGSVGLLSYSVYSNSIVNESHFLQILVELVRDKGR